MIGEMGVGKTTIGRLVARLLERPHLDSDELFETAYGMSSARFADLGGVPALHERELSLFHEAAGTSEPAVISAAASVIDANSARAVLEDNFVVWLRASHPVMADRRGSAGHRRAVDRDEAERLRGRRHTVYESVADLVVDTDEGSPDEVAATVIGWMRSLE